MCVGVTVSFGWGGVVSLCRLKLASAWWCGILMQAEAYFSLLKDTTPPQPNHTATPTHIEPEKYNT